MANTVLMPQKGISEESAVLSEWKVKPGDAVKAGDIIFSIETGKATYDVESEFDGVVLALLCGEGDELPIKAPVCVIGREGESFEAPSPAAPAPASPAPASPAPASPAPASPAPEAPAEAPRPAAPTASPAAPIPAGASHASPRAKSLAVKAGVDVYAASPTGPEGRIIERDVAAYLDAGRPAPSEAPAPQKAAATPAPAGYTDKPVSKVRKIIAENMRSSLLNSAQLTLNSSFDAGALLTFRKSAKAAPDAGLDGVTLGDMVLFAVSRTLPDFPDLNAHYLDGVMRYFEGVNLAFACDTPRGLLVPVIFGADKLSLLEISKAVKTLASEAQSGAIEPSKLTGGSFTVSNLGPFGIESFTPVINPPQTGLLGVNTMTTRVREADGEIETYQAMSLSLTFDHRALDGAPAARFLKALCQNLERFNLLLAK